jgi:nicotinate-nucleotide adenylyltransferase
MRMNIVYGGSFNPPTKAHKLIIDKLFLTFRPNNIIVVPVGDSYNKASLIPFNHRFEMAKLLDYRIIVSDYEHNDKYLGTYNLLNRLKEEYDDLYYVIGSDNLINLDKWIDYKDLLRDFKFIVFNRHNRDLQEIIMDKYPDYKSHFLIIEIDYEISSTEFRETLNKDLIPEDVYKYIVDNKLYGVIK